MVVPRLRVDRDFTFHLNRDPIGERMSNGDSRLPGEEHDADDGVLIFEREVQVAASVSGEGRNLSLDEDDPESVLEEVLDALGQLVRSIRHFSHRDGPF